MEPFLIYTNTNKIASDKGSLTAKVQLFQGVYDAIIALNVTPTLQEIADLLQRTISTNALPGFEYNYIVDKLLDAAAPYSLNGVELQRNKVREMITPPDVTQLKAALSAARQVPTFTVSNDLALMTLDDDVISKVVNSDDIIEARSTYYTLTDASTTRALELQAICDQLNDFDTAHGKAFANHMNNMISYFEKNHGGGIRNPVKDALIGIELRGNFAVSLKYIRVFEASNPA